MPGRRQASIVLPTPGGPLSSRLWPPAAATISACTAAVLSAHVAQVGGRRRRRAGASRFGVGRAAHGTWPARRRGPRPRRRRSSTPATARPSTSAASPARAPATHEPVQPGPPRRLGDGQRALAGAHGAGQRQLAEQRRSARAVRRRHLPAGGEHAAGQREIEAGPDLAQMGRGQVGRDAPRRELEAGVEDRRVDALARLAHGRVAQPHDREGGQAGAHVDLHRDRTRVEPVQREGAHAREHRRGTG